MESVHHLLQRYAGALAWPSVCYKCSRYFFSLPADKYYSFICFLNIGMPNKLNEFQFSEFDISYLYFQFRTMVFVPLHKNLNIARVHSIQFCHWSLLILGPKGRIQHLPYGILIYYLIILWLLPHIKCWKNISKGLTLNEFIEDLVFERALWSWLINLTYWDKTWLLLFIHIICVLQSL